MATTRSQPDHGNQSVRIQVRQLLEGGHAHQPFEEAVKDLPFRLVGRVPEKLPYSIWQLVEHIRIAQWDILEFSKNPVHQSPPWPKGYWPEETAPPDEAAWQRTLLQIREAREAFLTLLDDPQQDLYAPFAHGDGQNLLREALLIADHTSYHTGQIILIRRLLEDWEG